MSVALDVQRSGLHERAHARLGLFGDVLYSSALAFGLLLPLGLLAWATKLPLLFASLGPTIFLAVERPRSQSSVPRNQLLGHAAAALASWAVLALFGLVDAPDVLESGVTLLRAFEASTALAVTFAVQLLLRASHPPAAATSLLVALGFLQTPREIAALVLGAAAVAALTWAVNRALRVPMHPWAAKESRSS